MTSEADREKTKTAPELGPELKLLVRFCICIFVLVIVSVDTERSLTSTKRQVERNPECADCGTEQPTWVSINIGVLVCHECSGAHRSLGTHISKIKSLTLDKWESHTIEIIKALGNKRCNNFWEHTVRQ
jgi:Arf-GAP/coiled-coil/ANK repeat/PH domain-containing protein